MRMFVCGFGEIVRRGHSVVLQGHGRYGQSHLGYLDSHECDTAYHYVVAKRKSEHLPGCPSRSSVWAFLCKHIGRLTLTGQFTASKLDGSLLEKIIEEDQRRNRQ